MKRLKKIASLTAALMICGTVLLPSTSLASSAATDLTIKGTDGQSVDTENTYTAYQVFKGDIQEDGSMSNVQWGSGVNGEDLLAALKSDNTLKAYFVDSNSAANVANVIQDFESKSDNLNAFAKIVSAHTTSTGATSSSGIISGLEDGYYFIKSGDGSKINTKYILTTVNASHSTVTTKGDLASIEKKVYEDENDNWQDVADAEQGDEVKFRLAATLPSNYGEYNQYYLQFKDSLSAGFTEVGNVKYYVKDSTTGDISSLATSSITAEISSPSNMTFTCTNTKTITQLKAGDTLIVEYTAKLSEGAIVTPTTGNDNAVTLVYSNNPNVEINGSDTPGGENNPTGETPEDKVRVLTYEFDGTKVDSSDPETSLSGATFKLYRMNGDKKEYATGTVADGKLNIASWGAAGTEITTESNGKFSFKGLDDGIYYLEETAAPTGYNKLTEPIKLEVNSTFTIDASTPAGEWTDASGNPLSAIEVRLGKSKVYTPGDKGTGTVAANIENSKGSKLPSTGGIGTTIFYVAGGILVVGSGVLLISKKRMKNKEK